jgi:hypothetical protein
MRQIATWRYDSIKFQFYNSANELWCLLASQLLGVVSRQTSTVNLRMASGMNFRCLQALQFQRLVHLFLAGVSSHYNEAARYLKLNMKGVNKRLPPVTLGLF